MSTIKNTSIKEEVIVLVSIEIKPEKAEEFERIFSQVILKTRLEKDVIAYNVFKNQTKANHYNTVEKYANKSALEKHLNQDYFVEMKRWLESALKTSLEESISFATEFTPG